MDDDDDYDDGFPEIPGAAWKFLLTMLVLGFAIFLLSGCARNDPHDWINHCAKDKSGCVTSGGRS